MIKNFRDLLSDSKRIIAFQKAINELIGPDTSVLEIGSALGTYSFFAVQAQAKAVHAVEMGDIYYAGEEIAKQNRFFNKIQFYHKHSKDIQLSEKVDLIIMEDYSPMFLYNGLSDTLHDARIRLLKPEGKFIPNIIIMKFAPVQYKQFHDDLDTWKNQSEIVYDINWDYTTELVFNQPYYVTTPVDFTLSDEIKLSSIDLSNDSNFHFNFSNNLTITRPGTIHGLVGWWDCWFTPTQSFSNSPLEPINTWGQMFFPFRYPIKVKKSERVFIHFQSFESRYSKTLDYLWKIEHSSISQEQNTFKANILPISQLIKNNIESNPLLNKRGRILRSVLNKMNNGDSWAKIAKNMTSEFSDRFSTTDDALTYISPIIKLLIE